jgi:hypothetical protein
MEKASPLMHCSILMTKECKTSAVVIEIGGLDINTKVSMLAVIGRYAKRRPFVCCVLYLIIFDSKK